MHDNNSSSKKKISAHDGFLKEFTILTMKMNKFLHKFCTHFNIVGTLPS